MEKEYLYVGHYIDVNGNYILKVGTTNNLERRRKEHCKKYPSAHACPMQENEEFVYDWTLKLSRANTLKFEAKTKENWQEENFGKYIRQDRFCCKEKPRSVFITIRKTYEIIL